MLFPHNKQQKSTIQWIFPFSMTKQSERMEWAEKEKERKNAER